MTEYVPQALRRYVEERANSRCEYCLIDGDEALFPHEPDHVIAVKHGGLTDESNLAWACFLCNRFKGSDIASIDPDSGDVVRLFDPRRDQWNAHFRILSNGRIHPLSDIGRATARLLRFNLPESVQIRKSLIAAARYPN